MNNQYRCSDPDHEGDRTQIPPADRLELRHEYRRLTDYGRERVFKVGDVCRPCMRRKHPKPVVTSNQVSLLTPSDVQTKVASGEWK